MSSASRQPHNYHLIGHGTVPLICCLDINSPRVECIRCPFRCTRLWRNTSRRLLIRVTSWPSSSPAASSFFFVGRKDGGLRPSIDYRALNTQTVKLPYRLPLIPATLEEPHAARIFSKLDLCSAYNLVRIWEGDEWKTPFITPSSHNEYLVMPYGLSNAPSVLQELMNKVFREFLHRSVIVYIDDILIYLILHLEPGRPSPPCCAGPPNLHQFHLYLKLEKCKLHHRTVQFLGYIIGEEGIQMDQGKVTAVTEWPTPQSVKELQRFIGFANFYCCFIKGFSLLTALLTILLRRKPKSLSWSSSAHDAFESLRTAFSMAPILRHPDTHAPFVVEVDASTMGVRAVLSQQYGEPPALCLLFKETDPSGAKLRQR